MLNVAHITTELGIGGTEKAMEQLVLDLDARGLDVTAFALEEGGVRESTLRRHGCRVIAPVDFDDLSGHLIDFDTDVLHIHAMPKELDDVLAAATEADVPFIVRTAVFGWPKRTDVIDYHLYPSKMTLYRYLVLSRTSIEVGDWAADHGVLHYSVDASSLEPPSRTFRDDLGIDPETVLLGKIGRPDAAKWTRLVVQAFARLRNRGESCELVLVTPPEKIIRELTAAGLEGSIHVLDSIPPKDISEFYHGIDILTHSSAIGESFGYVIAESLGCGTPVVVDSNPMRDNAQVELVDHDGCGYVAAGISSFADATADLIEDAEKRVTFGDAGQRKVRNLYETSTVAEQLVDIYHWGLDTPEGTTKHLTDQRKTMREFASSYPQRLRDYYGRPSPQYRVELGCWHLVSRLPLGRNWAYHRVQGAFKPI